MTEFLRQNEEQNAAASQTAGDFLKTEAAKLKRKLETSEHALHAYREEIQSVSLEDRQSTVVQKLAELSLKATEAKSQRIIYETDYKQVQALGTNIEALLVVSAANNPTIKEIRANIAAGV